MSGFTIGSTWTFARARYVGVFVMTNAAASPATMTAKTIGSHRRFRTIRQ